MEACLGIEAPKMDLGDGGPEVLAGGLEIVDATMHWASTFFFMIHMVFYFLFIGFCIVLHSLIGFFLFGVFFFRIDI